MLLWRDRERRTMATPTWLEGAKLSRVHTDDGDIVTLSRFVDYAADRGQVWHKVSDGWEVAEPEPAMPFSPSDWMRQDQLWTVVMSRSISDGRPVDLVDGTGRRWVVPAILSPETGAALITQKRRLTSDGWVREPLTEQAAAALDAARDARQWHIDNNIATAGVDQQQDWICACIEAVYHLDAMTIGVLGLVDDRLAMCGMIAVCGLSLDGLTGEA